MKKILLFLICALTLLFTMNIQPVNAAYSKEDPQELRGVWISTVSNIDISRQNGTSQEAIEAYKEKLIVMLDRIQAHGMNTIFFQVRPSNDAFYESEYNLWSEFLVGKGVNPGWDMLEWLIDECHRRGMEFHAWLNPYRVTAGTLSSSDQNNVDAYKLNLRAQAKSLKPDLKNPILIEDDEEFLSTVVLGKEGKLVLNPAKQATIDHVANTIDELIRNYDVDGIHFDDYFYPSGGIETKYDTADYNAYKIAGGTLSVKDWRRDNVDRMVKRVSDVVAQYNSEFPEQYTAFGISPAPVWAPSPENCGTTSDRGQVGGMNVPCGSYSTYNDLYADTKKWVENEWLDYILPQAYTTLDSNYPEIVTWWSRICSKTDVKLYVGTGIYLYENGTWQDPEELMNQFAYVENNSLTKEFVSGYVFFSYRNLVSSNNNCSKAMGKVLVKWAGSALHPTYREEATPITDEIEFNMIQLSNKYLVTFNEIEHASGYILYAVKKGETPDFAADTTYLRKVYNQIDGKQTHEFEMVTTSLEKFDYILRVYDELNNVHEDILVELENVLVNEGPRVEVITFDSDAAYSLTTPIPLKFGISSDLDLPLTVKLYAQHNGNGYKESYDLTLGEDGYYSYEYEPFIESELQFKLVVSDTDQEVEIELDPITVGKAQGNDSTDDNVKDNQGGGGMSCNMGAAIILPLISACGILILKKKEN